MVAYGSVQAAFQHGIMAPLRRPRRDPPPPELEQPQPRPLRIEGYDYLARGDAPAPAPAPVPAPAPAPQHVPRHRADDARLHRNNVHQRRRIKVREEPALIAVETLRTVNQLYSEDETDAERLEESPEAMENPPADSESENQQETEKEVDAANSLGTTANTTQSAEHKESDSSQSKNKPSKQKEKPPQIEPSGDGAAAGSQPAEGQPPQTDVPVSYFLKTHTTRSN